MDPNPEAPPIPPMEEATPSSPAQKKILYVITKANWGGAQRYVFDLAVEASRRGYAVAVAYGEEGPLAARLNERGIRTIAVPALKKSVELKSEWSAFRGLLALLKEERPDLVHVNSSKAGLALLAARVSRVPRIIFTAHGWAFNEARPWWQKLVIRAAYIATIYLAHETICVSEAVRKDLGTLPFAPLSVIRHGIEPPAFLTRKSARATIDPNAGDAFVVGVVAELHPTKRIEDVIEAVALLTELFPTLRLVVMGEGPLREWLQEVIAHYKLESRVTLAGFRADAVALLHAFDAFILPSRTEALGYVLIEAGYAGLPVIASRVGGIPEVIEHKKTGLLVPPENPHALARALRALVDEPEVGRVYGAALKERAERLFGKDRMFEETFATYRIPNPSHRSHIAE